MVINTGQFCKEKKERTIRLHSNWLLFFSLCSILNVYIYIYINIYSHPFMNLVLTDFSLLYACSNIAMGIMGCSTSL